MSTLSLVGATPDVRHGDANQLPQASAHNGHMSNDRPIADNSAVSVPRCTLYALWLEGEELPLSRLTRGLPHPDAERVVCNFCPYMTITAPTAHGEWLRHCFERYHWLDAIIPWRTITRRYHVMISNNFAWQVKVTLAEQLSPAEWRSFMRFLVKVWDIRNEGYTAEYYVACINSRGPNEGDLFRIPEDEPGFVHED